MTDDVWDIPPPTPEQDFAERLAHHERMRAKVRELRGYYNDAMRYRWLRAEPERALTVYMTWDGWQFEYRTPEMFDEEVDSAMKIEDK